MSNSLSSASIALALALAISACRAPAIDWTPTVVYRAEGAIERIRAGRVDPADPGPQAVSVDQAGDVALVHFAGAAPRAEVLQRAGAERTGLVIADVDPSEPGVELYAGGAIVDAEKKEIGGAVDELVVTRDPAARVRVRRIHSGPAYVHSIERIPPQRPGEPAGLLVSNYAGEVRRLAPSASGAWSERVLYRAPAASDPEVLKIKDAGFLLDPSGRAPHVALVAFKLGRLVALDLDAPESARVVHEEAGGLSRVTPDPDGGAWVTGYAGRVLHVVPEGASFRVDVVDQEGTDSGLRGAVLGTFPIGGGETANLAVFGFHRRCRALLPRKGVLDPVTLFVDVERGHAIEAAELVPGNAADELLLGGYSKQVTLLVARPR